MTIKRETSTPNRRGILLGGAILTAVVGLNENVMAGKTA
jgi:hypothetical protein